MQISIYLPPHSALNKTKSKFIVQCVAKKSIIFSLRIGFLPLIRRVIIPYSLELHRYLQLKHLLFKFYSVLRQIVLDGVIISTIYITFNTQGLFSAPLSRQKASSSRITL